MKIDLNCDLGESFGAYTIGLDSEVMQYISSANVACGFHASDPCVMSKTVKMCAEHGVAVGAHPGHLDLQGFGRRVIDISPEEAKNYVMYQVGALTSFCKENNLELQHVKPHGALYNQAGKSYELSYKICEGIKAVNPDLILLGLSGSQMLKAAEDLGLRCASEIFADRNYNDDGSLVKRGTPKAMVTDEDEMLSRVVKMVKTGFVTSVNGNEIPLKADSVCVHGDGVKAVEFVKTIRSFLEKEGIEITNIENVIS